MINQCKIFLSYQGFTWSHGETCLVFVVKRILKMNMDMIIAREGNKKHRFHGISKFENFEKMRIFKKMSKIFEILYFSRKEDKIGVG